MESGIALLNRMKEKQNKILIMKKISNEIYEETTGKIKELSFFEEQIKLKKKILEKQKQVVTELESENNVMNQNIVMWQNLLNTKKESLEIEKKQLKELQNSLFSARINYCDTVKNFLNEKVNLELNYVSCDKVNDSELASFRIHLANLEQELEILEKIIEENKVEKLRSGIAQKLKVEESRYQSILNDRKNKLRKLVYEVKLRKLQKNKKILNQKYSSRETETNFNAMPISIGTTDASPFKKYIEKLKRKSLVNTTDNKSESADRNRYNKRTDKAAYFSADAEIKPKYFIQNLATKKMIGSNNNLRKITNSEGYSHQTHSNLVSK